MLLTSVFFVFATACARPREFIQGTQRNTAGLIALDVNHDGRADYWQEVGPDGRKVALRFDDDHDGQPDTEARLDAPVGPDDLRVTIILDGVPYSLIAELYEQGHFRLFPPAGKVVSVFPVMTDLALTRALTNQTCLGYEALYFDRDANRLSEGNEVYLKGLNAPWWSQVDVRSSTDWDVRTYLDPKAVWRHELDEFLDKIRRTPDGVLRLYSVATAGLGTRGGREAILQYLKDVDQLCERVTYERRGKARFTLFADHGHGLTEGRRVSFADVLRHDGFSVAKHLRSSSDVVVVEYGLVTCAIMHAQDPPRVADALAGHEAVDLVMYRADAPDSIVVRNANGSAIIGRRDEGGIRVYTYDHNAGDPLGLAPLADSLRRAAQDRILVGDDREWFQLTVDHEYPDPLFRIWEAFGGLVRNPADVIVSLKEGYFCGSRFFSSLVNVASTHGALSAASSVTFLMSNDIRVPPSCRIGELRGVLPARPELARSATAE